MFLCSCTYPKGSLLVSVGGTSVCVWDMVGGGRLLKKLTNFQKTVTTVKLSPMAGPDSAAAPRLLTGSLDGHVKVGPGCLARCCGWVLDYCGKWCGLVFVLGADAGMVGFWDVGMRLFGAAPFGDLVHARAVVMAGARLQARLAARLQRSGH